MKTLLFVLAVLTSVGLSACGSAPPPADWILNAQGALELYQARYLDGDDRLAKLHFDRAQAEVARSGRLDLMARTAVVRCATRMAALEAEACDRLAPGHPDLGRADRTYLAFLGGDWKTLDPTALPKHYQALIQAKDSPARSAALAKIQDPLARLVASATLLRQNLLSRADLQTAIDTASDRGWRRALLAWLSLAESRALAEGDTPTAQTLRQRIELVTRPAKPGQGEGPAQ